jgi:hypothetical protein
MPLSLISSFGPCEAKSKASTPERLIEAASSGQPVSEGDLLRARVSNNIGQASDQTVANLLLTEHSVVSIPAAGCERVGWFGQE